ncbi:MAG TPA: excinuclease ABC subunit UvrC [Patescibacteria group bacterium]
MNLSSIKQKIAQLPQNPGVYFFCDSAGAILYIGKATNLRSRVSSYFRGFGAGELSSQMQKGSSTPFVAGRSEWIGLMVSQIANIDFQETDSVLEALILESNLIKKHQPKYNTLEKDDKSFAYFVITKEDFPRILILRKTDIDFENLEAKSYKLKAIFGPYTSKYQMETALKIMRRIFPFHALKQKTEKGCLDFQLGMCPGPYEGAISKEDYKKNIRGIRMILEGKKKRLVTTLEKEMQILAKKNEFEKAAEIRNKIFALNHIMDIALMTRDFDNLEFPISNFESNQNDIISKNKSLEIHSKFKIQNSKLFRIEAYDISNISGQNAVGSMAVFENGKPAKSQYRKFKIKTIEGSDDVGSMREVLSRRFHNDWPMPDLILLDGGQGHLNMATKLLLEEMGLALNIAAVAKGPTRKKLDVRIAGSVPPSVKYILADQNLLKSIMDEAHRFAITFHRKLRRKNALQ